MRQVSVAVMAIGVGIIMGSCQKEKIIPGQTNDNTTVVEPMAVEKYSGANRNFYYMYNPEQGIIEGVGCYSPGWNCLPTMELHSKIAMELQTITDVIGSGVKTAVQAAFISHTSTLLSVFPEDVVLGVIDGSLTVKNHGDLSAGETAYVQFYDINEQLVVAVPLKL